MNRRLALGGVAAAAGIAWWALGHEGHVKATGGSGAVDGPRRPSAVAARAIGLETAEVGFGTVEEVVRLSGVVRARPDRRVAVAAPVSGMLAEMSVQPGDAVKRGDVVAVLNSAELARLVHEQLKAEVEFEHARSEAVSTGASLNTLRGQLAAAERQAELAEQEVARMRAAGGAVGENVMAQREALAIQARSQADSLRLTIEQQTREWKSLEKRAEASGKAAAALSNVIAMVEAGVNESEPEPARVGIVRLRSPLDGVVVKREGVVGQGVEAGITLAEVADYSRVQVVGELPESLVGSLESLAGASVRIRVPGDGPGAEIGRGVVRGAAPVVDPVKRTAHVVIEADNMGNAGGGGGRMREGMYVDVAIVRRTSKEAVVAPLEALVSDGPVRFVFVKERGAYVRRDVRIRFMDDRVAEIVEGLVPGDEIVVRGAYAVSQLPGTAEAESTTPPGGGAGK